MYAHLIVKVDIVIQTYGNKITYESEDNLIDEEVST